MSEPSFYDLSEGQKNGVSSHDTSRAGFHHQDLAAFSEDVNSAAKRAFPNRGRSRYQTVNVCLIRWEDDELGVQRELNTFNNVLQDYGFRTDVFLIPGVNSHWNLMRKTLDFIQACDNDQNLFVLYYAGHGRMNSARQAEWVFGQSPNSPFVDWSAIQGLFGTAKSDVLILLDTCAAASSATTSQFAVMETIAACGFERRAPPPGEHSLTNTLVDVLRDWINKPSFSAASLHTEILFRLKLKETRKGREGIPLEWCVTPIHWINTKDCKASGIEICRRNILPSLSATPSSEAHGGEECSTYVDPMDIDFDDTNSTSTPLSSVSSDGHYKVPHVLITLQLEENQPLDARQCTRWLDKFPLLAKWVKVEAVFPSYSTLMILSIPMPIWDLLPDHPACSFIGYITSPKLEGLFMSEEVPTVEVPTINESSSQAFKNIMTGDNSSVEIPSPTGKGERNFIEEEAREAQEWISLDVKDGLLSAKPDLLRDQTHQLNDTTMASSKLQPLIASDAMTPSNLPGWVDSGDALATVMRIFQSSPSIAMTDVTLLKKYSLGYKQLGETGQNSSSFLKFDSAPKGDLKRSRGSLDPSNFTSHWTDEGSLALRNDSVGRQRRASRPKIKTGCNNCKNRRVKCDEMRPQCNKCVQSGRQCYGYPAYKRTVEVAIPIAPRPCSQIASIILKSSSSSSSSPLKSKELVRMPPRSIPKLRISTVKFLSPTTYKPGGFAFNAQEGQYFQVFQKHTASELSGFFDSEFWTRSVLQESDSVASIRHAVVAMGALYKTLEKASESPPGSPDNNSFDTATNHYSSALQQYGKALTRLRESLENQETRSQRTILISIVLFTCFQSFTGDHKAAIFQIQSGLGLLEERQQESRQPLTRRKDDIVEEELVQIFTRLAIQAKSYDMAFHFPHPYIIRLSPQRADPTSLTSPSSPSDAASTALINAHIPANFTTSQEARQALDSLCERIMRFNELLSSHYPSINNTPPRSVQSSGHGFKMQLSQWEAAFQPLLDTRRHPHVSNTERAGRDVLRMIHLMTTILFIMGFSKTEMDVDNFVSLFKEIVELAKELVVDEELLLAQESCGNENACRHTASRGAMHRPYFPGLAFHYPGSYQEDNRYMHIKASFALDLGIVPPLFVVATKCRDRKVRREAIRLLLSSPRREGMWDSILSGRVAQWIMEIEEEGLSAWEGPWGKAAMEKVEGERRVTVKEILFDMQRREATLRCGTRGAREGDPDARARVKHIWW